MESARSVAISRSQKSDSMVVPGVDLNWSGDAANATNQSFIRMGGIVIIAAISIGSPTDTTDWIGPQVTRQSLISRCG